MLPKTRTPIKIRILGLGLRSFARDAKPEDLFDAFAAVGSALDEAWSESKHPRGQPGNAGQFGPGGGSAKQPSSPRGEQKGTSKPAAPASTLKASAAAIPKSEFPLNKEQQTVEHKFNRQIEKNPHAAIKEYKEKFGNVLNADNAKELSPDYLKNRSENAPAVHEGASWLVKQMFHQELQKPAPPGKENAVVFTAGGAGAGKTTAIEGSEAGLSAMERAQVVYDGTLRPAPKAIARVEQALKAGKQAVVLYVYRDPVEAFKDGVLGRAARQEKENGSGRTVPIGEFVAQHASIDKSMAELAEKFKDHPDFHMGVIDNSHGRGNAKPANLEDLPVAPDPKELRTRLKEVLDEAYKNGHISRNIYKATLTGEGEGEIGM